MTDSGGYCWAIEGVKDLLNPTGMPSIGEAGFWDTKAEITDLVNKRKPTGMSGCRGLVRAF